MKIPKSKNTVGTIKLINRNWTVSCHGKTTNQTPVNGIPKQTEKKLKTK